MATKAEQARARRERSGSKKKNGKSRHAAPSVVASRKRAEAATATSGRPAEGTALRNVEIDRGDHQTYDLEDSGNGRPSRKSTRKAAHHAKPNSNLQRRQIRRV